MVRSLIIAFALAASTLALAEDGVTRFIDLRNPQALAELKQSNPAHFEKIQQILSGLQEQPERAEGDWLQTNFNARDVNLSRFLVRTSNPPKQVLQFTLDDVCYTMHLVRSDLVPALTPVK